MNEKIILYSVDCPKCKVLKRKLESKGISFVENNSRDEMLDMGITEVPVLAVNGKRMDFSQAVAWINNR